jgi:hypothetical protein
METTDFIQEVQHRDEKVILSISLGASTRDHESEFSAGGHTFRLLRKGTDGSLQEAVNLIRQMDGKVDAFSLGNGAFYLAVNRNRYAFRQFAPLRKAARLTRFADGSRVKGILNEMAIRSLKASGIVLEGMKTYHMGAVERFGQAKSLTQSKCNVVFGDFLFGMGLQVKSLKAIERISTVCLPVITRLPQNWLFPVVKEEPVSPNKYRKHLAEADFIVGDFSRIKGYLPEDLEDKIIMTNITTPQDVDDLQRRGLKMLITTTPRINGRSFGINIIEAMLFALIRKPLDQITDSELYNLIERIGVKPGIEILN